jgi:hypothetical protein
MNNNEILVITEKTKNCFLIPTLVRTELSLYGLPGPGWLPNTTMHVPAIGLAWPGWLSRALICPCTYQVWGRITCVFILFAV